MNTTQNSRQNWNNNVIICYKIKKNDEMNSKFDE